VDGKLSGILWDYVRLCGTAVREQPKTEDGWRMFEEGRLAEKWRQKYWEPCRVAAVAKMMVRLGSIWCDQVRLGPTSLGSFSKC
jgi:hypothetical protein